MDESLLSRWGVQLAKFSQEHKKLIFGTAIGLGIYAAHPLRGQSYYKPFDYMQQLFLGDPHATGIVGADIMAGTLNKAAAGYLGPQYAGEMANDPYGMFNFANASEDMDQFLAQEVQYRNYDTTRNGPNGMLVFGLYNNRMNYT
jgi:hypothetical protein